MVFHNNYGIEAVETCILTVGHQEYRSVRYVIRQTEIFPLYRYYYRPADRRRYLPFILLRLLSNYFQEKNIN